MTLLAALSFNSASADDSRVSGHYVREGDSSGRYYLILDESGYFALAEYNVGMDSEYEGEWKIEDEELILMPPSDAKSSIKKGRISKDLNDMCQSQRFTTLVCVLIRSPGEFIAWRNVDIIAEFDNGKSRAGRTGDIGELLFVQRVEPEWAEAKIKRIHASYSLFDIARTSFDVDDSTKTLVLLLKRGAHPPSHFKPRKLKIHRTETGVILQDEWKIYIPIDKTK